MGIILNLHRKHTKEKQKRKEVADKIIIIKINIWTNL